MAAGGMDALANRGFTRQVCDIQRTGT